MREPWPRPLLRLSSAIKRVEQRLHAMAEQLYDPAAVYAKHSMTATVSGSRLKANDVRAEADKAMMSLNRLVAAGFHNAGQIRKDPAFEAPPNREGFKKL